MVSNRLVATVLGSGSVYYIGNPVIKSTVTGSGRLVKIAPSPLLPVQPEPG